MDFSLYYKNNFPLPAVAVKSENAVSYRPAIAVLPSESNSFEIEMKTIAAFINDVKAHKGIEIKIAENPLEAGILLCETSEEELKIEGRESVGEAGRENYEIYKKDDADVLIGEFSSRQGLARLLATMFRFIEKNDNGTLNFPYEEIADGPCKPFRGFMVDLARDWHPFEYLLDYVDMCYFYKLSTLQLHFTDTQSYTLPSDVFPKLPTEGRHYTKEEIARLNEYAKVRGVSIVPEIDAPGHMTPFEEKYPEIFGSKIISLDEKSMDGMRMLLKELCEMFPDSEYIHIGGDEAELPLWIKDEKSLNAYERVAPDDVALYKADINPESERLLSEKMLAYFDSEMAEVIFMADKTPIVWEGFGKVVNDRIRKDIIVMSWENYYQTTPELIEAGFDIIHCAWNPNYIVTPNVKWTPEEIIKAGTMHWDAVHPQSPILGKGYDLPEEYSSRVLGSQILAWGDQIPVLFKDNIIEGVDCERRLIEERLAAITLVTWNTSDEKVASLN